MSLPKHHSRSAWSFRLILVCLAALSVSLPMAWISIAKVCLFIFGLLYFLVEKYKKRNSVVLTELWTVHIILLIITLFSMSIIWTDINRDIALSAFIKHSKLLEIILLICLIRTPLEARIGITVFAAGQSFLLLSSWLIAAGVQIPWKTHPIGANVVFSTYLDQSIIFATTAAVIWHLRSDNFWPRWLAGIFAGAALINVFLLLEGRTGYAVALVVISLAVMWATPKRFNLIALIATPMIVLFSLYFGSSQINNRLSKIIHESKNYESQNISESSSGWRLNAWHRSLEAIKDKPWIGHGVGSWTLAVKKFEGKSSTKTFGEGNTSNPHQEYLLWGVELGVGGILLLIALMVCIIRDALRFKTSFARAIISVVAAISVACMFNSTLYDALIGDFFCILLGLLIALGTSSKSTSVVSAPDQKCMKAVA